MSIQKDVWVRCDRCSEMGFASHTSKQARKEARENGWVFRNGKDYCKDCAPTPRAQDEKPCPLDHKELSQTGIDVCPECREVTAFRQ